MRALAKLRSARRPAGRRAGVALLAALAALALAGAATGCAPAGSRGTRAVRFASPLIGGAGLPSGGPELGPPGSARDEDDGGEGRSGDRWLAARDEDGRRGDERARPARRRAGAVASATRPAHLPATRPAPVRTERTAPAAPTTLGAAADPMEPRSWVGARDGSDPMMAVLALCRRRYLGCPAELPDLPEPADAAERTARADDAPRTEAASPGGATRWLPATTRFDVGDLLLFDRVGLDNKEQLVALVTARQARGVFEIAYLAAGVWRRGLIDPARPRLHRDREGRVVNTFLRHRRASLPKGTRFLSGELLIGVLPLPRGERGAPRVASAD